MGSHPSTDLPAPGDACLNHSFERAQRVCRHCGHWFCDQCVVTPWGPRKPALCVECAVNRGGVRSTAGKAPVRSDREIKRLERAVQEEPAASPRSAAAADALHRAAPSVATPGDDSPRARRSLFRRLRPS